jgi:hypothetical protein
MLNNMSIPILTIPYYLYVSYLSHKSEQTLRYPKFVNLKPPYNDEATIPSNLKICFITPEQILFLFNQNLNTFKAFFYNYKSK